MSIDARRGRRASGRPTPAACTVMIRHAMLNSVRWIGLRSLMRNVHWLNALAAATSIVSFGPSSSSDAKSTAYDTDIVDERRASGRFTLKTDVIDESSSSADEQPGAADELRREERRQHDGAGADDGADVDPRGEGQGLHWWAASVTRMRD